MKKAIAEYFNFSRKERNGIAVLLFLIGMLIITPFFFPFFIKNETIDATEFSNEIAMLKEKQIDSAQTYTKRQYASGDYKDFPKNKYTEKATGELFYFDPNTATADEWKRLGLKDKTIATIQKYVSKGGKFYKPEDISKIWGLHPDQIERLMPFIQIKLMTPAYVQNKSFEPKIYQKTARTITIVELNDADTTSLIALPGIGSKLSQRILNFRDKLGGFYSIEQVGETFGLPDSTFQKIKSQLKLGTNGIRQININTITIDELKTHPYLRYTLANAIIQYRNQHGNFATIADLKKIMIMTDEVFSKVSPYLKVN
ncbi:MAG: helix-hairpin-helix domain-containing protein [Ferruginibacter sp.]